MSQSQQRLKVLECIPVTERERTYLQDCGHSMSKTEERVVNQIPVDAEKKSSRQEQEAE